MEINEYKYNILTMLGSPILNIEVEDHLNQIINCAFLELKEYIDTPHYDTVSVGSDCIDLTSYKVRAILYVTRGTVSFLNASENTDALLWSPLTTMMTQTINFGYNRLYSQTNLLQDYNASLQYRQLRNTINPDLDYTYDSVNKRLYLYQQIPKATQVTIVYNKRYDEVSEIEDPFWVTLLFKLALAYTKQVLGRVRGKYKMSAAPYELDAETLLSEANSELSEIRQFLNDNNNIFIPRD